MRCVLQRVLSSSVTVDGKVVGEIGPGLLVRMLAAPLLASLFLGLIVASLIARTTAQGLERDDHT